MMEAARTSETLVNFYQTARRYNPEESHLHTHHRENLKSKLTECFKPWKLLEIQMLIISYVNSTCTCLSVTFLHMFCLLYISFPELTWGHSFTCVGIKFSASGREDVDVRTLGRGRPFVCELLNPHRIKFTAEQVQSLESDINKNSKEVSVRDLQIVQM
jgi:hypothetical protein